MEANLPNELLAMLEKIVLHNQAFVIYKKNNYPVEVIEVLINNIENFSRAAEFAEKTNLPDVWIKLANAYLN